MRTAPILIVTLTAGVVLAGHAAAQQPASAPSSKPATAATNAATASLVMITGSRSRAPSTSQLARSEGGTPHAAFPGVLGRLYRAAVIGSGGHRLVTRRLLRQVARAT